MGNEKQKRNVFAKTILRSITALLIGLVVAGSTFSVSPQKAHALDGGGSLALIAKEMADAIAWIFGDMMIAAISGQTYEWSMEGFGGLTLAIDPASLEPVQKFLEGDTAFLTNPQQFFSSIGDEITTFFLSELEIVSGSITEGIREGVAIAARDGNENSTSRLVTTIGSDRLASFLDGNFSGEGGWQTWLELTNNPQNYFDGAMQIALTELNSAKTAAVQRNKEELAQSGGFLSLRQCQTLTDLGITDPQLRKHAQVDERGCADYKNVTPGGLVGDKVKSAISADLTRIAAADEITEIIAALVTTAIDQLVQQGFSEITKVTRNFGTPSQAEESGTAAVDNLRSSVSIPYINTTSIGAPQPANPNDGTSWPSSSTPTIDTSRVSRGDYWAQIRWNAPAGVSSDDIEGYIIYRFEDISRQSQEGETIPPNRTRDTDEPAEVIAVMNRESGTLAPGRELLFVDSTISRTKQYGYAVVAYDPNYNRSARLENLAFTIVGALPEYEDGESPDPRPDIIPILKLTKHESAGEEMTLPDGSKTDANLYEAEVGAYWVDPEGNAPAFNVPSFDVLVSSKLSTLQVPQGQQWVFSYGHGSRANGATETIQFLVPKEDKDKNIAPQVNLEISVDPGTRVRETNAGNNTRNITVHFDPSRNDLPAAE